MREFGSCRKATTLIRMYGRCGKLPLAQQVFDSIPERDLVSWTAIIAAYARNGHGRRAMQLFHDMESAGIFPDAFAFTAGLDACSSSRDLTQGRALHAKITERNLDTNVAVANALLNMYSKCEQILIARNIFKNMKQRDAISWNTIIAANAQAGHCFEALKLYREMDLPRTASTFVNAIAACCGRLEISYGKMIHCDARSSGMEENPIVASALVDFYGKCGRLDEAVDLFDRIKLRVRSAHLWTSIISACTRCEHPDRALEIYREMSRLRGIHPDAVTFVAVLNACSTLKRLEEGREIHLKIVTDPRKRSMLEENAFVANSIVNLYGKCCCPNEARQVFDAIKKRDIVSWNSIISAYAQAGNCAEAIRLFYRMEPDPNEITFQIVLSSCAQTRDLDLGSEIHARIHKQGMLAIDSKLATAVVEMYCGCGVADRARKFIEEHSLPDSGAWTTTLAAYARAMDDEEQFAKVFELHLEMELHGVDSDAVTFVCLLTACSHAGAIDRGREVLSAMADDRGIAPVLEHYACFVDVLARAGWLTQAEELLRFIPFEADAETYMALLGACRMQNDIWMGCRILHSVVQLNPDHVGAYTLIHNMLTTHFHF